MPLTNVTTAITAATPITTPSKVSAERSLFAHNDRNAILMASVMFMGRSQLLGLSLGLDAGPSSFLTQFSSDAGPARLRVTLMERCARRPSRWMAGRGRRARPRNHTPAGSNAHREFHRHKRHQQRQHGPDRRRPDAPVEDGRMHGRHGHGKLWSRCIAQLREAQLPLTRTSTSAQPATTRPGRARFQGNGIGGGAAASRRTASMTETAKPDDGSISSSRERMD